ncbi:adhesion G-protein coupled receptor D1-like [Amphiura filiformis]|uniref:adhesion G-protein coupled receptor D1-like n=1 Tax=Amphiura filiformis TaxID=82378 RepID=UPI003B20BC03
MRASNIMEGSQLENVKVGVNSAFMLFPMLGTTWIFGLLSSFHIAFSYLFTIMNSLQGVWLACVCVLINSEVRKSMAAEWFRMTANVRSTATKFNSIAPSQEDNTEDKESLSRGQTPIDHKSIDYSISKQTSVE